MKVHSERELVDSILKALQAEGVKCQSSKSTTHLVFLGNSHNKEFILKLRAFEDFIKVSLWNSDYLFTFDLMDNVVHYFSKSNKIRLMISMLERQGVIGPSMTCYQYAGFLFMKNNPEWRLKSKGEKNDVYINSVSETLLTVNPFYIEMESQRDPLGCRMRIEYQRGLRDNFWYSTQSKKLDDILFFLDEYKKLNEILRVLKPWSINGVFHPIL